MSSDVIRIHTLQPGDVVPGQPGGDNNPFNPIWLLIISLVIGFHIADGNFNKVSDKTQRQVEVRNEY